jgi:hypothetical protein
MATATVVPPGRSAVPDEVPVRRHNTVPIGNWLSAAWRVTSKVVPSGQPPGIGVGVGVDVGVGVGVRVGITVGVCLLKVVTLISESSHLIIITICVLSYI